MSDQSTCEGSVSFPSRPGSAYRYKITTTIDSVSFWLEDQKTKNQWVSDELMVSDFVNSKNVIPQASLADYVSCFQSCLETKPVEDGTEIDCRCDLVPQTMDSWALQFVLLLKAAASVWRPMYEVALKPISVQQIAILAAQVRNLQEEVVQLRSEIGNPTHLTLVTTQDAPSNGILHWKPSGIEGDTVDRFVVLYISGVVRFLQSGWYSISLTVIHGVYLDHSCYCELQCNGACARVCTATTSSSTPSPRFSFAQMMWMSNGEELKVVNKTGNNVLAKTRLAIFLVKTR